MADAGGDDSELDRLLEELIERQRSRVRELAQRINPHLTDDDLLSPEDVPDLRESAPFAYEDGQLAGLLAAQMALRARRRDR